MRRSKEASFKSLLEATRRSSNLLQSDLRTRSCPKPQGPIYDAVHDDLVASGCKIVAKYFDCIIAKENELAQTDLRFKKRIRQSHCLLLASIENLKSAEQTYISTGNRELTLKLLVQTVHMIQAQEEAYRWVVKELYQIILKIGENWDQECKEMMARTRFEYGQILAEMGGDNLDEAIRQMSRSLCDCKGTLWYTNERDRYILEEDCCVRLCELLLLQAEKFAKSDPGKAADLAQNAWNPFLEVGIETDLNLFCIAKLREAEYRIANADYDGALQVLSSVQSTIMPGEIPRNKSEFYLLLGICHFFLNQNTLALKKLKLSLDLSDAHDLPDLKAKALLYCGKIHAKDPSTQAEARESFMQARDLFRTLKDSENEQLAKYLMAKLRTYQIFPAYIELLKQASYGGFCYFFDLMNWKQKMLPFWREDLSLPQHEDEVMCLMEEDVGKEVLRKDVD